MVQKALELGNRRMEHAGEVSGLNKVVLRGVSATHPAVARGTAWAAMANNGELCTSASVLVQHRGPSPCSLRPSGV